MTKKIDWNKSGDDPTVNFSFKVINLNSVKVQFAGRVTTELVQRHNPSNVVVTIPVDGFLFNRAVMPNEVIEISGKLEWLSNNEFMPRIILPTDSEGLYWTFSFDKPITDPKPRKRYSNPEGQGPILDNEVTDLLSYLWSNRNDLRSYIQGVGYSFAKSTDRLIKSKVYYRSPFQLRADNPGSISYDQRTKRVVCRFDIIDSSSYDNVNKRYNEIVLAILDELPILSAEPFQEEDKSQVTEFRKDNIKWAEVTMNYDPDDKAYSLNIEFFGKVEE